MVGWVGTPVEPPWRARATVTWAAERSLQGGHMPGEETIRGRTRLVTGASSGIGWELSRLLAADGNPLVLVSRDRSRLELLATQLRTEHRVSVRCEARDLSEPNAAFELWAALAAAGIAVDVLVN